MKLAQNLAMSGNCTNFEALLHRAAQNCLLAARHFSPLFAAFEGHLVALQTSWFKYGLNKVTAQHHQAIHVLECLIEPAHCNFCISCE